MKSQFSEPRTALPGASRRDEPDLFVPRVFGWGWTINFARLFARKPKRG